MLFVNRFYPLVPNSPLNAHMVQVQQKTAMARRESANSLGAESNLRHWESTGKPLWASVLENAPKCCGKYTEVSEMSEAEHVKDR